MGRYNPLVVLRYLSEVYRKNAFADKSADAENAFSPKKSRCFTQKAGTRCPLAVGGPQQLGEQRDGEAQSSSSLEKWRFSNSAIVSPTNVPVSMADALLGHRIISQGVLGPFAF